MKGVTSWCFNPTLVRLRPFILKAQVNPKPVDPGIYRVEFLFQTSGTPVSQPVEVRRRIEQKVWLMESTIVR